jgi:hypothetical protein
VSHLISINNSTPLEAKSLARLLIRGEQGEVSALERTQRSEMSLVESQHSGGGESICQHDRTQIGQTGVHVLVTTLEFNNGPVLVCRQINDRKSRRGNVLKKGEARCAAHPPAKEVVDFRGRRRWNDELTRLSAQNVLNE